MRITTEKLPTLSNLWLFIVTKKKFEKVKEKSDYNSDYRITIVKDGDYLFKTNSLYELKIWLDLNNLKITDFGYGNWTRSKEMLFGERGCFLLNYATTKDDVVLSR